MSSGGFAGFCPGFRTVTGHAGLARGRPPGAWGAPVSRLLPVRVSGPVRVKDRAGSRPAEPAPQASLTRRAAIR